VLASTGFDYWESGEDFLGGPSLFHNFVQYQSLVLEELRRLADRHGFTVIDASRSVGEVFEQLVAEIRGVIQDM
jgi:dTMP kinase